jgi:hypothetical protein
MAMQRPSPDATQSTSQDGSTVTACLKLLTRQIRAATISQAPTARVVLKTYPRKKFRICLAEKPWVETSRRV